MFKASWRRKWFWLVLVQTALLVAAAWIWFYFRTLTYLAGPPDGDLYAWNWGYQEVMFLIYWLPIALFFSALLAAAEYLVAKRWAA